MVDQEEEENLQEDGDEVQKDDWILLNKSTLILNPFIKIFNSCNIRKKHSHYNRYVPELMWMKLLFIILPKYRIYQFLNFQEISYKR